MVFLFIGNFCQESPSFQYKFTMQIYFKHKIKKIKLNANMTFLIIYES